MLKRIAGHEFYYFLDSYSGYNQIAITLKDQEKITFTCSYGTFAFKRVPCGLCNVLPIFSVAWWHYVIIILKRLWKIFMNDFCVFGLSYDNCLHNLNLILQRYEQTKLVILENMSFHSKEMY